MLYYRYLAPPEDWGWSSNRTPLSSRKVFGSIEKHLDKMKNMLTPRKKLHTDTGPSIIESKVRIGKIATVVSGICPYTSLSFPLV